MKYDKYVMADNSSSALLAKSSGEITIGMLRCFFASSMAWRQFSILRVGCEIIMGVVRFNNNNNNNNNNLNNNTNNNDNNNNNNDNDNNNSNNNNSNSSNNNNTNNSNNNNNNNNNDK